MGTAIKHPVSDRVKQSFVILTPGPWASECLDVKNYKRRLNPVWHRMLYSCTTHMATVGIKGLTETTEHWEFPHKKDLPTSQKPFASADSVKQ